MLTPFAPVAVTAATVIAMTVGEALVTAEV
jgi:hypothetical protein